MAEGSKAEYGDPVTQLDLLRQLSPIHKIDQVKAPVLVMHRYHDTNVPLEEAEQVVAALKARRVPVSFIIFPGEDHGWQKISTRIDSHNPRFRIGSRFADHLGHAASGRTICGQSIPPGAVRWAAG